MKTSERTYYAHRFEISYHGLLGLFAAVIWLASFHAIVFPLAGVPGAWTLPSAVAAPSLLFLLCLRAWLRPRRRHCCGGRGPVCACVWDRGAFFVCRLPTSNLNLTPPRRARSRESLTPTDDAKALSD